MIATWLDKQGKNKFKKLIFIKKTTNPPFWEGCKNNFRDC
jgi:SET domain-containing protein